MPQHSVSPSQHSDTVSNLKNVPRAFEGRSGGQSAVFGNHHTAVVVQPRAVIRPRGLCRLPQAATTKRHGWRRRHMSIGSGLVISRRASVAGYFAGALALGAIAMAGTFAAHATETLQLKTAIPPPAGGTGKITSFDISFVDTASHTYILGDRTNSGVDVFDTTTNTLRFIAGQGMFTGVQASNDVSGPDGVMIVFNPSTKLQEIWAGDGDSTLKIFD